jgi:DNA-binding response OmpR family regulator
MQLQPRLILVADDDPVIGELLQVLLEGAGYSVARALSGDEIAAHLEFGQIDLLLPDLRIPGYDSLKLVQELRKAELGRGTHLPIIIVSASSGEQAELTGRAAGADDYIAKPFELEHLLTRVEALLIPQGFAPHLLAPVTRPPESV